jgi:hypothetical protein
MSDQTSYENKKWQNTICDIWRSRDGDADHRVFWDVRLHHFSVSSFRHFEGGSQCFDHDNESKDPSKCWELLVHETSPHILCECEALASLTHVYLGSFLEPEDIKCKSLGGHLEL